jgi:site-specific recombinase XerD
MEERQATPTLQEFPQLQRLAMFSPANHSLIADYLAHLRARHYAPSVQEGTLRALKSFASLMPQTRQAPLYANLTQTTPTDIDSWIEASFRNHLAPSTVATRLRVVQGFFGFLRDQGSIGQSPIRYPRHHILVPQDLPRPMAEDEVVTFFRVIDVLRDRTMFLLMLRCGLRVGEVSGLPWSAIDLAQGTVRIDNSKGHVDRVVYLAPDVAKALRQWQRLYVTAAHYVFPSRLTRKGGVAPQRPTNPQPDDPLPQTGRHSKGLFAPFLAAYVCHTAAQCRCLAGGGQRADGAPLPRHDPPLHATL